MNAMVATTDMSIRQGRTGVKRTVSVEAVEILLDRPVAYHRAFAKIGGSTDAGIFLSQAWFWSSRTTLDGEWFYKTGAEWEEETGLSRRQIDTVRRKLKEAGILEDELRGTPAKLHYRIDRDAVYEALDALSEAMHQNAKLDALKRQTGRTKTPNKIQQKRQTVRTESTSEITPETTTDASSKKHVAALVDEPSKINLGEEEREGLIARLGALRVTHEGAVYLVNNYATETIRAACSWWEGGGRKYWEKAPSPGGLVRESIQKPGNYPFGKARKAKAPAVPKSEPQTRPAEPEGLSRMLDAAMSTMKPETRAKWKEKAFALYPHLKSGRTPKNLIENTIRNLVRESLAGAARGQGD